MQRQYDDDIIGIHADTDRPIKILKRRCWRRTFRLRLFYIRSIYGDAGLVFFFFTTRGRLHPASPSRIHTKAVLAQNLDDLTNGEINI